MKILKITAVYYAFIFIPFLGLIYLSRQEQISPTAFVFLLLFYLGIYRTVLDVNRLVAKGVLPPQNFFSSLKMMFLQGRYWRELYLP